MDLNDPNCLRVYDDHPVATEWPTDPDEIPLWTRIRLYLGAVAFLAALFLAAYWWLPAALILGAILGAVFALRVKLDIRPQWPM